MNSNNVRSPEMFISDQLPTPEPDKKVITYIESPKKKGKRNKTEIDQLKLTGLRDWLKELDQGIAEASTALKALEKETTELIKHRHNLKKRRCKTKNIIKKIERTIRRYGSETGNPEFQIKSTSLWQKAILIMFLFLFLAAGIAALVHFAAPLPP